VTEYLGQGDPRRSMALLWGRTEAPTRGPKQGLTVAEIVAAAIELADAEGLGALSMRKVADRLGRSAMSLYTYVPGKAELLDLMYDTVLGEQTLDHSLADGWRPAVEASAHEAWAFFERHPWVLQISGARSVLGPHEIDTFERQLRLIDGLGLSAVDMARIVGVVGDFVRGAAKAVADARAAEQATGMSDDDWWNARSAFLDELVDDIWPQRYPIITRISAEQAFAQADRAPDDTTPYTVKEALDSFEFGLQRLLDGIEAHIAATAPAGARRAPRRRGRA
jgi:AcrR family transcriptional regulator